MEKTRLNLDMSKFTDEERDTILKLYRESKRNIDRHQRQKSPDGRSARDGFLYERGFLVGIKTTLQMLFKDIDQIS